MFVDATPNTAPFDTKFFPQHILLLSVGENMMPMGYWTVISKDPFRFLVCMQLGNYSLDLLRKFQEAALHFFPWKDRERVVKSGHISGRGGSKSERLGFNLLPAEKLQHTRLVEGFDSAYETIVFTELEDLSAEFAIFVLDVVARHGKMLPVKREPIFFLSLKDFGTMGEKWKAPR
jgi:flavin reductase (DIM6/NTAB) family NADH-FMN oxidoreductase RutF